MAKLNPNLRAKLLEEKNRLGKKLIVDNKNFEKGTFRLCPTVDADEVPGQKTKYLSLFSKALNGGVTSPRTWGLRCAIADVLDELKRTDGAAYKEAYKVANINVEHWCVVFDKADLGTVEDPNPRILRVKQGPYGAIIDAYTEGDEDDAKDEGGEDIADAYEGRYFRLKKAEVNGKTEWKIAKWFDPGPICDDDDLAQALVKAGQSINVFDKMYKVDRPRYEEIYRMLTGEDLDPKFWKQKGVDAFVYEDRDDRGGKGGASRRVVDRDTDDDDDDDKVADTSADDVDAGTAGAGAADGADDGATVGTVADDPDPDADGADGADDGATVGADEDPNGICPKLVAGTTRVSFDYEDGKKVGVVKVVDRDVDDLTRVVVTVDDDGLDWDCYPVNLTIVEPPKAAPRPGPRPAPQAKPAPAAPAAGKAGKTAPAAAAAGKGPAAGNAAPAAARKGAPAAAGPGGGAVAALRARLQAQAKGGKK